MTSYKTNLATSCYDTFDHPGPARGLLRWQCEFQIFVAFFKVFDKRIQSYEDGVGQILTKQGQ